MKNASILWLKGQGIPPTFALFVFSLSFSAFI